MRFLFSLFLVGCFSTIGYSQNTDTLNKTLDTIYGASAESSLNAINKYRNVQIPAEFPGGIPGWTSYLERNLDASLSRYLKIPSGQDWVRQTVYVTFIVDKEGAISDVKVINESDVHPKLAAEAIRVIRDGPKWKPAVQNGKNVIYRHKQGISWVARIGY